MGKNVKDKVININNKIDTKIPAQPRKIIGLRLYSAF